VGLDRHVAGQDGGSVENIPTNTYRHRYTPTQHTYKHIDIGTHQHNSTPSSKAGLKI
jgi:hypothetical protein